MDIVRFECYTRSMREFSRTVILTILSVAMAVLMFEAPCTAQSKLFTVRDSIEMVLFDQLAAGGTAVVSPDHKYFVFSTSRGIISSNALQSTIWMFKTDDVKKYLKRNDAVEPPMPLTIAAFTAIPKNVDLRYSLISDMQWLPNSKSILFLVQNSQGERQIYAASVASGSLHALTPRGYDVTQFVQADRSIFYEATPSNERLSVGEHINADATDVTGLTMEQILFPQADNWDRFLYHNLGVLRDGKNAIVTDPATNHPLQLLNRYENTLSLSSAVSPDGHSLIELLPIEKAPRSWSYYEPTVGAARIEPPSPHPDQEWLSEYGIIDLASKVATVVPLIQAANAAALTTNFGGSGAVWSPSGRKVLLRNTFLPIESVSTSELTRRRYPCMVAVADVRSKETSCVEFYTAHDYAQLLARLDFPLQDATFGSSDNEVVLTVKHWPSHSLTDDRYHYRHGAWQLAASVTSKKHDVPVLTAQGYVNTAVDASSSISLVVKQDVNTPPALWATEPQIHVTSKLWDPNPQLRDVNLGKVSVLRWNDASGYAWTAGLVMPPNYTQGTRYPLVIQTHGFDQNEFMSDGPFTTAFAARPLASAGVVVLQMDFNATHEVSLREIPDQIFGFESAIRRLTAMGLIDPQRVGIIGFSRTCYHVEGALINRPRLFAAASITDGVDESYMQSLLADSTEGQEIYGGVPSGRALLNWVKEAPGFSLDRVRAPLLITALSPWGVAAEWEIYASLRTQKKPVDLIYLPQVAGYQHGLQRPLDRLASQQSNVDWFRFWLQGYEDPNLAKQAQYARWRSLRALQTATTKR